MMFEAFRPSEERLSSSADAILGLLLLAMSKVMLFIAFASYTR